MQLMLFILTTAIGLIYGIDLVFFLISMWVFVWLWLHLARLAQVIMWGY